VLRWARAQRPPRSVVDIVTQDEYTHDVVLPFDGSHFLVLGATLLGSITGVAVWDHRPSAAELLAERLRQGWRPTPSRMRGGDRVWGYAARAVTGDDRA
jgi:hypothetical protein